MWTERNKNAIIDKHLFTKENSSFIYSMFYDHNITDLMSVWEKSRPSERESTEMFALALWGPPTFAKESAEERMQLVSCDFSCTAPIAVVP